MSAGVRLLGGDFSADASILDASFMPSASASQAGQTPDHFVPSTPSLCATPPESNATSTCDVAVAPYDWSSDPKGQAVFAADCNATELLRALWRTEGPAYRYLVTGAARDGSGALQTHAVPPDGDVADKAVECYTAGLDCFAAVAEFNTPSGRDADSAAGAWVVWLDVCYESGDSADRKGYVSEVEAMQALTSFCQRAELPEANLIVDCAGRYHVCWALDARLAPSDWVSCTARLRDLAEAHQFRTDLTRPIDIGGLLRVPGPPNQRFNPPRPTSIARTKAYLDADQFLQAVERAHGRAKGRSPTDPMLLAHAVPSPDVIARDELVTSEKSAPSGEVEAPENESRELTEISSQEVVLSKYSLLGQGKAMAAALPERKQILGGLAYQSQATVIYADSNVGKTMLTMHLLTKDIENGLIDPTKVFYLNADDDSHGLAEKLLMSDAHGFHMLSPGFEGFDVANFKNLIEEMIRTGTASGVIVVLDTLKKFANLMDKTKGQQFTDLMRRFVLAGGGVIGLAHLNKNSSASGKPIYSGTSDMVNDLDCVMYLNVVNEKDQQGRRVVAFSNTKRRGRNASGLAFSYVHDGVLTYEERLATIREDGTTLDAIYDAKVIKAVRAAIGKGVVQKQQLIEHVRQAAEVSRSVVQRVLSDYAGSDPKKSYWAFCVGAHNTHTYRLISPEADSEY